MNLNYHTNPLLSFARKRTDINRNMEVIDETFFPIKNKKILDVGCGRGGLLKALENRSAIPTGIDINDQSLAEARRRCKKVQIHHAGAEDVVFEDNVFDGTIFLYTLHHIPEDVIQKGLENALHCTKQGCPVLILEPLNFGGYFEILKPLEDETAVCQNALMELHSFIESKKGRLNSAFEYMTYFRVSSIEKIIIEAVAVDPKRAEKVSMVADEMAALFNKKVQNQNGHLVLEQPMIGFILTEF